jgi:hypothetical protein
VRVPEKRYIVRFKPPETSVQLVMAETVKADDKYLIFLYKDGTIVALFDLDVVENWTESN